MSVEATIIKATGMSLIVLQFSKSFPESPDIVQMKEFHHVMLCPWLSVIMPQVVIREDQQFYSLWQKAKGSRIHLVLFLLIFLFCFHSAVVQPGNLGTLRCQFIQLKAISSAIMLHWRESSAGKRESSGEGSVRMGTGCLQTGFSVHRCLKMIKGSTVTLRHTEEF